MVDLTIAEQKKQLRELVLARRNAQDQKDELSRLILHRLVAQTVFQSARVLLVYLDVRSEVRTRELVSQAMTEKRVIIPFCTSNELELFELRSWSELQPGRFGILEPRQELRSRETQIVPPGEIDLAVLPGVAFDRKGGRVGYGKGFFDHLIPQLRSSVPRIGLAFECQMVDSIPLEPHDCLMNLVITEKADYSF